MDDEKIIENLIRNYDNAIVSLYAKSIAEGLKTKLDKISESIVRDSERILLNTLTRRIIQVMYQYMIDNIEEILRDKFNLIENQLRRIVKQEISKTRPYQREEPFEQIQKEAVPSKNIDELRQKIISLSSQLRACKMDLAKTSEKLGRFFNLMLKFEPRFHALPIIEQSGEIDIDELARILRTRKQEILEFLRITTNAGITIIRGNKVSLVTPIFRSRT